MDEEEVVKQIYLVLKQYIPAKEMQSATDHLVDDLQEILDEETLYRLGGLDKYMKNSVQELLGEEDFEYEDDEY
jgi:hypothetical protein